MVYYKIVSGQKLLCVKSEKNLKSPKNFVDILKK